ncbi:MAG TPA: dephospho-CoA kinase [Thiobacillaceae bacterium]|nr:dephospho-CoA kinase [Thiobacillaceae bacterium]
MNRPFCVGLTGGIASGKSTVAKRFAESGAGVVDTDRIAHDLTRPGGEALPSIAAVFGAHCLDETGALDRKAMRAKVFADPQARRRLEAILHPLIRTEAARRVAAAREPYVILVVPLLVESGQYGDLCDRILVVDCDPEIQVRRASARDGADTGQVRAILAAQAGRDARLAHADDVIDNNDDEDALDERVRHLHANYLALAESFRRH